MTIESTVSGVSDRVYNNALKAKMRDPSRSIRLIDFMTIRERESLIHTSLGDSGYELYLQRCADLQWREFNNV